MSGFGSEVESELQPEQAYRTPVIRSEVDLLFFQVGTARASDCDLVGCEVDSVPLRVLENIPMKLLIRAWRGKTAAGLELRGQDLHVTAQFTVGAGGHEDLEAKAHDNQKDRDDPKDANGFVLQQ